LITHGARVGARKLLRHCDPETPDLRSGRRVRSPHRRRPNKDRSTSWIRTPRPQLRNPSLSQRRMPGAFRDTRKRHDASQRNVRKNEHRYDEAADLIRNSYRRRLRVCRTTTQGHRIRSREQQRRFDFVQKMSGVKSSSVFVELGRTCTKAGRDADRADQATCDARQKVTLATAEPLKTASQKR